MEVEEQVDISYEADLHESATWLWGGGQVGGGGSHYKWFL